MTMEREMYKIINTEHDDYPIIVVSMSIDRVYSFRNEITDSLRKLNYAGVILFDQIGCNGDNKSRFQTITFNGLDFEKQGKRILRNQIPESIECIGKVNYLAYK